MNQSPRSFGRIVCLGLCLALAGVAMADPNQAGGNAGGQAGANAGGQAGGNGVAHGANNGVAKSGGTTKTGGNSTASESKSSMQSSSSSSVSVSSSGGKPTVQVETHGPGSFASGDATISINGKTETIHSESRDGQPAKTTRNGNLNGGNNRLNAGPNGINGANNAAKTQMRDALNQMEQQIKASDMPDDIKQRMLQMLKDSAMNAR